MAWWPGGDGPSARLAGKSESSGSLTPLGPLPILCPSDPFGRGKCLFWLFRPTGRRWMSGERSSAGVSGFPRQRRSRSPALVLLAVAPPRLAVRLNRQVPFPPNGSRRGLRVRSPVAVEATCPTRSWGPRVGLMDVSGSFGVPRAKDPGGFFLSFGPWLGWCSCQPFLVRVDVARMRVHSRAVGWIAGRFRSDDSGRCAELESPRGESPYDRCASADPVRFVGGRRGRDKTGREGARRPRRGSIA